LVGRRGVVFRHLIGPGTPVDYELGLAYRDPSVLIDAFDTIARAAACAERVTVE
jgi:hypothetical protein